MEPALSQVVTKNKVRDLKMIKLYSTDAWSFDKIGARFGISGTRARQIIYRNAHLLQINRNFEKQQRINHLKKILKEKGNSCDSKDAVDLLARLKDECEGRGTPEQSDKADTRVIIIREAAEPVESSNRINGVSDGDTNKNGSVSGPVSVVRI